MPASIRHAGPAADAPPLPEATPAPVQTPTQQIVAQANQVSYVVDERGRRIGFKPMNVLETSRFLAMVGADRASNQSYLTYVQAAMEVVEIDGKPLGRPPSVNILEGRLQLLGDEGYAAVYAEIIKRYEALARAAEAEADGDEPKPQPTPGDALKNGPGTPA